MKAQCSVCGRVLQLRGNQVLRLHLAPKAHYTVSDGRPVPSTPRYCAGSGQPAKVTA